MSVTDIVMIVTHIVTEVIFIVVQVQKVQKVHMFSLKSLCKYRALFRSIGKKGGFPIVKNR